MDDEEILHANGSDVSQSHGQALEKEHKKASFFSNQRKLVRMV
jgi:hypothetical protein